MAMIKNLAELKARGELQQDDTVAFTVGGATFEHNVNDDHLSYKRGRNDCIFDKLGVNAEEFCSQAYRYEPEGGSWPESYYHDFAALTRAVEAIYIEIARQGLSLPKMEPSPAPTTKTRTPGQPALISSVADVDAYAPLQVGDRIFFQKDGEELSLLVNKDHDGYFCGRGCSERGTSSQVFDHVLRGTSRKGFAQEATGKAPSRGSYDWWPQYQEVEEFQKLLKALLTAYGQTGETEAAAGLKKGDKFELMVKGDTLYHEGDVVRTPHGGYRRILDVLDGGKCFFLSDGWATVPALYRDPSPRVLGTVVTLEELKRDYTRVVPETPAAPAAEEHRFAEGDLLYDPEDEDYACILAASSDGNVFALSQWTTDRADEDMLSTPDEIFTLEEIKEHSFILAPAEEPKEVLHLTRDQIAEKFGVDPDQLEIHDEAA